MSITMSSQASWSILKHIAKQAATYNRHMMRSRHLANTSYDLLCTSPCIRWAAHTVRKMYPLEHFKNSYSTCTIKSTNKSVLRTLHLTSLSCSIKFTWADETFRRYLQSLVIESDSISSTLNSGLAGVVDAATLSNRLMELSPIVPCVEEIKQKLGEIDDIKTLSTLSTGDDEMRMMAEQERQECEARIHELEEQLVQMLIPAEQTDKNDIILEVVAGVGGQEAMLFTQEIFEMLQNYALFKRWQFQPIFFDRTDIGGVRRATAMITGDNVYKNMKYEVGVHRVQRVPKTEKMGRVHTSTVAVIVLPQPEEIDVVILPKDLRIDTFKAGGKGGQHVNKTESAVRITHLPTGTVAECQQERSQINNKKLALQILKSRIFQAQLDEQNKQRKSQRKLQQGTGGRSEKVRTYNFSQDRITDHRLNENFYSVQRFLSGADDLDYMIQKLQLADKKEQLAEELEQFAHQSVNKI